MKASAVIGLLLLAAGALVLFNTPGHVTWGNHHYLKHVLSYGLMGIGALFLFTSARR